ncbi:MAG: hypothetical protein ACR2L2_06505, partial [Acidobacteriota bacterium]
SLVSLRILACSESEIGRRREALSKARGLHENRAHFFKVADFSAKRGEMIGPASAEQSAR